MSESTCAIEIKELHKSYGKASAVGGLSLTVEAGSCYGFLGRNGAGKTTTIKCLMNLLRPDSGSIRVFGLDPQKDEVAVKARIGYVPEKVAFYPWMSVRDTLDYFASFRVGWNRKTEQDLLKRFDLDPDKKTRALSKGMKAQLSLICAVCPSTELLVLDEPTSGLDPIVRQEFIETVIGAYQDGAPSQRTVFVSTHLIGEFEGLMDEFVIIDEGIEKLTMSADQAREQYKKIRMRFAETPPVVDEADVRETQREGCNLELFASSFDKELESRLREYSPLSMEIENLTLEEIFIATLKRENGS
jgi:ABC-type multidrug transport system ATPase subunit